MGGGPWRCAGHGRLKRVLQEEGLVCVPCSLARKDAAALAPGTAGGAQRGASPLHPTPLPSPWHTAGKTYANCFLRTALPPSARCAKSYDVMRYNASLPACRALISHDDFSAADLLPPDAATITQLRRCVRGRGGEGWLGAALLIPRGQSACSPQPAAPGAPATTTHRHYRPTYPHTPPPPCRPVDRIVSAYEFAVDVAARGINSVGPAGKLGRRKSDWVGTLEVWPWSVLIPWFKQDMRERVRCGGAGAARTACGIWTGSRVQRRWLAGTDGQAPAGLLRSAAVC